MWILTIVLLLSSGDLQVVSASVDRSFSGASCKARAQMVRDIERIGVHVVSVSCSRTAET